MVPKIKNDKLDDIWEHISLRIGIKMYLKQFQYESKLEDISINAQQKLQIHLYMMQ